MRFVLAPCFALTAVGLSTATALEFVINTQLSTTSSRLIPVLVGGQSLTFTPNSIAANPGDVIQFQFAARNHTVTQSAPGSPCQPLDATNLGQVGMNSGFIPFDDGASGIVGTFNVPVTSTEPMFLYCAQGKHCQGGMVMTVNAQSPADLIDYFNRAAAAPANVAAKQVFGGTVAAIPLANAILPQPPDGQGQAGNGTLPNTQPPAALPQPTTIVSIADGGTATVFTTITVPPSSLPSPPPLPAAPELTTMYVLPA